MIKALILDMDGVIVDSEPLHQKAEIQIMAKYGVKIKRKDLEKYTGTTSKHMFTELIKKYNLKTTPEKIISEKRKIYLPLLKNKAQAIPGIITLIKKAHKKGLKLAVASSSIHKYINIVLEKFKLKQFFNIIVGAEDIKNSKPNPEIFLLAAKKLHTKPKECIVIEDAKLGVKAAKAAGMCVIGYQSSHSGNQDLDKADEIVREIKEIKLP